jgi:radical SAM protein with 4Fe4S-binding SPASM domain
MDSRILADFDATRDFSTKGFRSLCYAPYTSLYFDTRGDVRVCCHNWSHKVGNIASSSIADIWNGAKIAEVRTAVRDYDFSRGCSYCEWQIASRNFVNLSIAKWDKLPVPTAEGMWPKQMEFSIGNTCNLECVMCNGVASSSIRAYREKLPPLPNPYSDGFFEELRHYLPHLAVAKFLGGEPFLQEGCFRIWGMLIEDAVQLPCHVTTNGTVFNARVERVLDALPVGIAMSLDGFTKETVEGIRVNARYEVLMQNLTRFQAYALARKTPFGLTFCLMRQNWHELGEFCLFADDLGCSVFVNSVRKPAESSLYALPLTDLMEIVLVMERQSATLLPRLRRNKQVFAGQLQLLRQRVAGAVEVPGVTNIGAVQKPIQEPIAKA